ncbi:MAG: hypothetical protein SF162_01280 [bacterium]|nr:hypothetical protein [bacterium]
MTQLSIKQLTTDQYEQAREKAIERVKSRIGERPRRDDFKREIGSVFTALDYLAIVVFVAALAISSAHIITHMGALASGSYSEEGSAGIVLSISAYTIAHQVAMIFLAEASMLLFMVLHGMTASARAQRNKWIRWASVPLVLAGIAAVFVFVANWQSGIGLLESLMPPLFTVGIGFRLETLIVETLKRHEQIDQRYLAALDTFERASDDPTNHPHFVAFFRQAIWEKLMGLASNKDWKDAPAGVKAAAVHREMERDQWAYQPPSHVEEWQPESASRPPAARSRSAAGRSGNTAQEVGEGVSIPTTKRVSVNGNGSTMHTNGSHEK